MRRRRKAQKAKFYFVSKFKINYLFKIHILNNILSISQEIQEKEGSMIE